MTTRFALFDASFKRRAAPGAPTLPRMLSVLGAAIVVTTLFLASAPMPGLAQAEFGWRETPGVSPDAVNQVAREIWCPLCSGVRLDSCELRACEQMKDVIALKLAEGDDTEAIKAYFLDQYGPQILGEPPRSGFNWLAWILPVLAVTGGGIFLWRQAQRLVRPVRTDSATSAAAPANVNASAGDTPATEEPPADVSSPADAAERRLDEELARYG